MKHTRLLWSIFTFLFICILVVGKASANILNPYFEIGSTVATDWNEVSSGDTNLDGGRYSNESEPFLTTSGIAGYRFFSRAGCEDDPTHCSLHTDSYNYTIGDYLGISQSVDFSNIDAIVFDVDLYAASLDFTPEWHEELEAAVYIGTTKVWSSQAIGRYLDQQIDTSTFLGLYDLEFRLEAVAGFSDGGISNWFQFDSINVVSSVPIPSALWLFGSGLLGLIGISRRQKAA